MFRVDPQGKGSLFFDAPELEVHALAPAPNGGLYVATSPDGRIYKVDRDGKDTRLLRPGRQVHLVAGGRCEGQRVRGHRRERAGLQDHARRQGDEVLRHQGHARDGADLRPGRQPAGRHGHAGTRPARRRRRQGLRAARFAVRRDSHAAPRQPRPGVRRPRSAAVRRAAARARAAPTAAPPRRPRTATGRSTPSVSVEVTSFAVVDTSVGSTAASSQSSRENRRSSKGAVYRIAPDGLWDQLWESRDDAPYDLTFAADGALIVGTGNKGKIYRLDGDPGAADAGRTRQLPSRSRRSTRTLAAARTTRPRIPASCSGSRRIARRGAPTNRNRATRRWCPRGASISWRGIASGGNQIEVSTRSGNTETPDDTWSAWSPAYKSADGSAITSPKARYLQWRAVLTGKGDGPVLTSVTAAYLQRNLRPQVRSITVHPPGIVFQKPFTTGEPELAGFDDQTTPDRKLTSAAMSGQTGNSPALGRRTYQKGLADAHLEGRRRERRRPGLRRALSPRRRNVLEGAPPGHDRLDPRLGHDDGAERHLLREGGRLGRPVESRRNGADGRARQRRRSRSTTRRPPSSIESVKFDARPDDDHLRRQRRSLADFTGRVLERRTTMARRVPEGRRRRFEGRALRAGRGRRARRARPGAPGQRRDEQRRERPRGPTAGVASADADAQPAEARCVRLALSRYPQQALTCLHATAPPECDGVVGLSAMRFALAGGSGRSTSTALFARTVIRVTSHTIPSAATGRAVRPARLDAARVTESSNSSIALASSRVALWPFLSRARLTRRPLRVTTDASSNTASSAAVSLAAWNRAVPRACEAGSMAMAFALVSGVATSVMSAASDADGLALRCPDGREPHHAQHDDHATRQWPRPHRRPA